MYEFEVKGQAHTQKDSPEAEGEQQGRDRFIFVLLVPRPCPAHGGSRGRFGPD